LTKKVKRVRRRPEDAKALILAAAEKSMVNGGPASLRLQDVAKRAGVSHPTILHHFGSREGLVRALNRQAFERLTHSAINSSRSSDSSNDGVAVTFGAYRDGLAERMVWLMQSADQPPWGRLDLLENVVQDLHQLRRSFAQKGFEPDIADTRAVIHLTTIAAFGDALIGACLRQAGSDENASREAFERWFSALLGMFLGKKAHGP
jgi:AcrR family transcriptional regulator